MLDKILILSKTAFWTAAALLCLQASFALTQITETAVRSEWQLYQNGNAAMMSLARTAGSLDRTSGVLDRAERDLDKQLTVFNSNSREAEVNINNNAVMALENLDARLTDSNLLLHANLTQANASLALVAQQAPAWTRSLVSVTLPASRIANRINDTLPEFLNCDPSPEHPTGNRHCFPVVYTGLETSLQGIAFDIHREADRLTAEPCKGLSGPKRGLCLAYRNTLGPAIDISRLYFYAHGGR